MTEQPAIGGLAHIAISCRKPHHINDSVTRIAPASPYATDGRAVRRGAYKKTICANVSVVAQ
jgi:hypothetical protein